jgi:hypothetical protein
VTNPILNGRRYCPRTWKTLKGKFHAMVVVQKIHHYPASSAYGKRSKWRDDRDVDVPGEFDDRAEALQAARVYISNHYVKTPAKGD